jgi:16S rRNA (uracil1498-N3)-methyltransferase
MARRRFFVDRIEGDRASLDGQDAHHLARVLRAEPGQRYEITDGESLCLAEVLSAGPKQVLFRVIEPLDAGPPLPPIVIVAALFKFDRFEWMIEKVTELGVKAIIPVESARSEEGLSKAAAKRVERWRKIARESSQQSRRVHVPEIRDAVRLSVALHLPFTTKVRLDENPGAPPLIDWVRAWDRSADLALAIGPEGGWTDAERASMDAAGWVPASLGSTILRAETATVAAVAGISIGSAAASKPPETRA